MSLTDPTPLDEAEAPPPGVGSVLAAILLIAVGGFGCGYGWGGIGLLDGVRDGAHRAVRRTAGLEVDPLDTPTPSAQREGPGLDR